ncbi:MAG: helix-turn-helix domain-containing protein [Oligoflexia bacterium]|nr:helix-turn-helix domain-containing protein [Oligoflexia bacterium]
MVRKLGKDKTAYSYVLPPDAGPIDRAKYDVCRKILKFKMEKHLSQRQVAEMIGVPETRVSEILHYKIWKFSLDRLLEYYQKVNPKMVLKVA